MSLPDDPICELRLYRIEPGRLPDMERRMQDDLSRLFPRHGIRPVAAWSVKTGAQAPLFIYLMPWRNLNERNAAFNAFAADPEWLEARARTNAGTQLVERFEILFLRPHRDWLQPRVRSELHHGATVHELLIQEVAMGEAAGVRRAVQETAIAAWTDAGATVCGVFDVMSGHALPAVVFVLAWPSAEMQASRAESVRERLGRLRGAAGTPLFQRANEFLLREVPVDWVEQAVRSA